MSIIVESERKNLIYFVIMTFGFSWLFWLPSLLSSLGFITLIPLFNLFIVFGAFGPLVSSFFLTYLERGIDGVKTLWNRGWHCEKRFFLFISLTLIPGLIIFSIFLASFLEGFNLKDILIKEQYGYIFTEIIVLFFIGGPFQEEFGWRGYALDRLQSKWTALESSIILGGIWSIWHIPLFFINGTPYLNQSFFSFLISIIIISILFTWFHNNTEGSILVAMTFHSSINMSYMLFLYKLSFISMLFYTLFLDIFVIVILGIFGTKKLKL